MKKILITGSSGFVGSHLVEEALERNLEVYAGVRKTSSKKYLQDKRIRQHRRRSTHRPMGWNALKKLKSST